MTAKGQSKPVARRKAARLSARLPLPLPLRLPLALAWWPVLLLWLAACGDTATPPPFLPTEPPRSNVELSVAPTASPNPTASPTLPPRRATPAPTATSDVPQVVETSPLPTLPPLFPTSTLPPIGRASDFTATAGVPTPNLTPAAAPTGQLAFVQAGNLWVVDDTGGNRRQLTDSGDIGSDVAMVWNPARDRVAYITRTGELWALDLQGKRLNVFGPGRTARLAGPVRLPPLPTPPPNLFPEGTVIRYPQTRGGLQVSPPLWSPDGRYIAFSYFSGESGPLAGGEVWVAELTADKVNLIRAGEGFNPTWSPDSRQVAFLSRGETRQGPPRPTPDPSGQPLPTRSGSAESLEEGRLADQAAGTPSPTGFILYPGGTVAPGNPPTPGASAPLPATPTPTPTLNLLAFPTATPTPTYPPAYLGTFITNRLVLFNIASRSLTTLLESNRLPDAYHDPTGLLRSHVPAPLQAAWWSPDGRFVAFSDKLSLVGVMAVSGGNPVVWTGIPFTYAVYDLEWLPRGDGAFYRVYNTTGEEGSRLNLITFAGPGGAIGIAGAGDAANRALLKIEQLPGNKIQCMQLTPGGNFLSYFDGTATLVLRTNGSIHSTYFDVDCPAWSPFGTGFATVRKGGDRAITLVNLGQQQGRALISVRAVERVFWLRTDPTTLGGQPTPPPTPRP